MLQMRMPKIDESLQSVKYNYSYPAELDLRPTSQLHADLREKLLVRAQEARDALEPRFEAWNKLDQILTTYVPLTEKESDLLDKDYKKPVTMIVPYSFAALETLLTYMTATFLNLPIFKYVGAGPEDVAGAALLQVLISNHCARFKAVLPLHTMFRDALVYGFGVGVAGWKTITRKTKAPVQQQGLLGRAISAINEVRTVKYEGNVLENVCPYDFLPDPSVPVHKIQEAEYVGWIRRESLMNLLRREREDKSVFNVKYLRHLSSKRSMLFGEDESGRYDKYNDYSYSSPGTRAYPRRYVGGSGSPRDSKQGLEDNSVDILVMYVDLIPSEWKLGDSDYPQKWLFALAADQVIISAEPLDMNHGLFPIAVTAPDTDGYSSCPISRLEVAYPLQNTLDWLYSSHFTNIRKAINDVIIYDPFYIDSARLQDNKPGKLVPLKRPGWGKGLSNFIQQLNVVDVTSGHIRDSTVIIDLMQRILATPENLMGIMRTGSERRSATEARDVNNSAMSRIGHVARIIGIQAIHDLAELFAEHAIQYMSQPAYVRVMGKWPELIQSIYGVEEGPIQLQPQDISVNYDILVQDGSVPSSSFADLWIQLYQIILQNPMLMQQFDTVRIFKHIARLMGAKEVNQFVRPVQTQVAPNEQIQNMLEQGQVAPIEQLGANA